MLLSWRKGAALAGCQSKMTLLTVRTDSNSLERHTRRSRCMLACLQLSSSCRSHTFIRSFDHHTVAASAESIVLDCESRLSWPAVPPNEAHAYG